jgi:hypothetical protein
MATASAMAGVVHAGVDRPEAIADPLPSVRRAVRTLLLSSPAYQELSPEHRLRMSQAMVKVCHTAATLIREELESEYEARGTNAHATALSGRVEPEPVVAAGLGREDPAPEPGPLAAAQSAGSSFSGVSAERIAGVTRGVLNAVSFPRFVTELINGVFKAMIDSSVQQMNSYVELLNNVATSLEGFAASNVGPDNARAWLAERYPASFEVSGERAEPGEEDEGGGMSLRLKPGASMPSPEALKTDLGLEQSESVPAGDPERTLVPFARGHLAKKRQEMLATMVMLGMQRIVIESGRITASMRFHVDTRSAAQAEDASSLNFQNQINGSGSFGVGAWGASASMSNTIGYVSTQKTQTSEEMNTDLDLNSSVEINFKSDYLPLNRLASSGQAEIIRANSRNPTAEAEAARAGASRPAANGQERRSTAPPTPLTPAAPPAAPPAASPTPPATTPATPPAARTATPPAATATPPARTATPHTPATNNAGAGGTQAGGTQRTVGT